MQTITFSPDRLREARERSGLSQAKAALAAGVARGTIQNAESGAFTPQADSLARMANAYGVTIDSLFTHEPEPDTGSNGRGKTDGLDTAAVGGSAEPAHSGA